MDDNETKVLITSQSPSMPLGIIVEEDNSSTHAYLVKIEGNSVGDVICPVWIRNHVKAPETDSSIAVMDRGEAPLLPSEYCSHPEGEEKLNSDDLECLWADDDTAVAVSEKGDMLCVISFIDHAKVVAYSRDCIKEHDLALPLSMFNKV